MTKLSSYLAVAGTLPRHYEVAQWSAEQYALFFDMVNHFTDDGGTLRCTPPKIAAFEEANMEKSYNPFVTELLYRMDAFHKDPKSSNVKFLRRLQAIIRTVGSYVKKNPSVLNEELVDKVKDNPRMNWMLINYAETQTKLGPVVMPHNVETTTFQRKATGPGANPQVKLIEAMTNLSDMFVTLSKSVSKKELREMSAKDKIAALSKLSFIFSESRKFKPNVGVFNQINIYKSDKESVEKALLEYAEAKE